MTPDRARIPDDLLELKQRLQEWRAAHPPRSRLSESLWTAATEIAHRHGLHLTSKTLRLDYGDLKRRLQATSSTAKTAPPAFLELLASAPPTAAPAEYVVELESPRGRMRVAIKGAPLDWTNLLHAWRSAQP
jgi:hypothetical protein